MSTEQPLEGAVYARNGFRFRIEVRFLPYPWATFQYWAKVMGATRDATPPTALPVDQLPFRPVQCHGATGDEAVEQVRRQIDAWFDAHPGPGSNG